MSRSISPLEEARAAFRPQLPGVLGDGANGVALEERPSAVAPGAEAEEIRGCFPRTCELPELQFSRGSGPSESKPMTVGVVLSGGQAPGGHNVIVGLCDGLQAFHPQSRLVGFLGGPRGILDGRYSELTPEKVEPYRNTGGFDLIGSGRDKIETDEDREASRKTCEELGLDGLVIVGGDDSNTNAAVLAEHFLDKGTATVVLGVPKTIDGDMRGGLIEASFGFDTAAKVYSELIGNICRDAKSAGKYWHFVKLMGRSASHVALECALQTHPNVTLIGEEVQEKELTLRQIVLQVANVVRRRAEAGRNYGVCLVPEGLIEFIPEVRKLIAELNEILHEHEKYFATISRFSDRQEFVNQKLSKDGSYVFSGLPLSIQQQLLLDRDAHGNVQVSKIDTELLVIEQVRELIHEWQVEGKCPGKFQVQGHFFGYEGRCAQPSNFDATYTYALGQVAVTLACFGRTGYICGLSNLAASPASWLPAGVPLTSLMQMESRKGKRVPVIGKYLVRTADAPFRAFAEERDRWAVEDEYVYSGPIQYFGPGEVCDVSTRTLQLESRR